MLDHSIFVLSDKKILIKRFHVCTWDLIDDVACMEIGCEVIPENAKTIIMYLPFLDETVEIHDLYNDLTKSDNLRFIFNDRVKSTEPDDGTGKRGTKVTFAEREQLQFIKCDLKRIKSNCLSIDVNRNGEHDLPYYFRFLIKNKVRNTFAIKRRNITQSNYIYDFKINEKRNMPNIVDDLMRNDNFYLASIGTFFCLNVVPDTYQISFIDSTKLKNIRKLENDLFANYLPFLKSLKKDRYLIIFLKQTMAKENMNCSLFISYTHEHFGISQVLYSIFLNIFCTLVFSLGALHIPSDMSLPLLKRIPVEYWLGLSFLMITVTGFCFVRLKHFLKKHWRG